MIPFVNGVIGSVLPGVRHQPSGAGAAALFALPLPRLRFTPQRSPNVQACAET